VKRSISLVIRGDDGSVLLVRRPDDDESFPGAWGLPAVSLAPGESEEQAIARAGRTKLGVEVEAPRLVGEDGGMRDFEVRIASGDPSVPQPFEGTQYRELRWGDPRELAPAAARGSRCSRVLLRALEIRW
jgi:8-oxo-dGTP diphosphatase